MIRGISILLFASVVFAEASLNTVNGLIHKHSEAKDRYNQVIDKYNAIWEDASVKEKAQLAVETKATDSLLNLIYFEAMACLHSESELGVKSCLQAEDHLAEVNAELNYYEHELSRTGGKKKSTEIMEMK